MSEDHTALLVKLMSETREDMKDLRRDVNRDLRELRDEITAIRAERRLLGSFAGSLWGFVAGLLSFFLARYFEK